MNNTISIRDYADAVAAEVKAQVPVNTEVSVIIKNNGKEYIGITFRVGDVCPTVYVNDDYLSGYSVEEEAEKLVAIYRNYKAPDFGRVDQLLNFEAARDHVFPCLVNLALNQKAFDSNRIIYREWMDLCIAYRIVLPNVTNGVASIKVTQLLLNSWGITEEELYDAALRNLRPDASLKSITSVLASYMPPEIIIDDNEENDPLGMYVLTYKIPDFRGAACLLLTEMLEEHARKVGGSFIIFPSSINEVILCNRKEIDYSTLKGLVMSVNNEHVPSEAILSENVYYYDSVDKQVKLYTEETILC